MTQHHAPISQPPLYLDPTVPRPLGTIRLYAELTCSVGGVDGDRWQGEKRKGPWWLLKNKAKLCVELLPVNLIPLRSPPSAHALSSFCCMNVVLRFPILWTFLSSTHTHTHTPEFSRKYHKLAKQLLNILFYLYPFFCNFFLLIFKF